MSDVVSYMDAYRTDADVIYPIPASGRNGKYVSGEMTLSVHKLGGMALGESGSGTWIVEVHHNGELIYSDASLESGMPLTHLQAAVVAADFFANGESSREEFGERIYDWTHLFVAEEVVDSVM